MFKVLMFLLNAVSGARPAPGADDGSGLAAEAADKLSSASRSLVEKPDTDQKGVKHIISI